MAVVTRAAEPRRTERRVSRAIVLSFPRGRNGSRDEGLLDPPEYNAMYHLSRRNRNAVPPHRAKVVSGGRGGRHAVGAGACGRAEEVVLQVEHAVEALQDGRGGAGRRRRRGRGRRSRVAGLAASRAVRAGGGPP